MKVSLQTPPPPTHKQHLAQILRDHWSLIHPVAQHIVAALSDPKLVDNPACPRMGHSDAMGSTHVLTS